jgi:hypothetical protein
VATVTAIQSFVGRLEKDVTGPPIDDKTGNTFPGKVLKEGRSVQVVKGQNFDSNHPVVKAFPEMFGEVERVHPPVEQATAAPGEKRR